jgi:hypothetical protein
VNTGQITIGQSGINVNIDGPIKTNSICSTGTNNLTIGTSSNSSLIVLKDNSDVQIDGKLISNSINSIGSNDLTLGTSGVGSDALITLYNNGDVSIGKVGQDVTIRGTITATLSGYLTTTDVSSYLSNYETITSLTGRGYITAITGYGSRTVFDRAIARANTGSKSLSSTSSANPASFQIS